MYMTNKQFDAIEKALKLLPCDEEFNKLSSEDKNIIFEADLVMSQLLKKKKKDNERTAKYVAEKRKTNKNYAR